MARERAGQHSSHVRQDRRGGSDHRGVPAIGRGRGRAMRRRCEEGDMKRHEAGRRIAGALLCGAPIILAATLIVPGSAAEKDDAAAWPEITEQERALKSIPQDPDADGVILRRTRDGKIIIEKGYYVNVLDYHWRMKVLNERGKRHAEVHIPSHKYSRVEGIEARSIKPDGTIVPVAADQI